MAIEIPFLPQILSAVLIVAAVYLGLKVGKKIALLLLNSLAGLVLLAIVSGLSLAPVQIGLWSILIAGFGGVAGVLLLVILAYLGITI